VRFTASEIEAALATGHELRGIEVKSSGPSTSKQLFAKVTRAAISMGNIRDGGVVIVGLDDNDLAAMLPGLNENDLATWMAFDDISQRMAEYADPPLKLHVEKLELSSGAVVAVIEVAEFADLPHVCAREYADILRRGALYVRTRRMPQTAEIGSAAEMRELLDLATQKALRAYVETAQRAGVHLGTQAQRESEPSDDERFEEERRRGWDE
jgi:predicted HTH transcriptional regulator